MDKRIKELAEQAEAYADEKSGAWGGEMFMRCFTEKFYELVRQDERERVYNILISGDCDGSVKAYIRKILEQGAEN